MARRLFRGRAFSENGWPYVDQGSCTWIRVPGAEHVSLQIQNGAPLQILRAFAADYHAYVEPLRDADSACWTPDNSVATSNHPGGTSMDLNWNGPDGRTFRYGISKERAFPGGMARALDDLYAFYEGIMFCGGEWSIRDWMHHQLRAGTYDQKNDRPTEKVNDFIRRKIRADGFSTYKRSGTPAPPPPPQLSKADRYALAVMAEGRRRGITPRGIQIAFSVVYVESNWKMYANSKVPESLQLPHDAVGSDHDSVGLFQQRCPMWGPAEVLMDPTKSAGLFFDRLAKMNYNDPSRQPGDFAADVQRPAAQYRGRYQERMGDAVALYNRLSSTPSPQGDDELSAEAERMIRELYDEYQSRRRAPSRSFFAKDQQWGETPLGFLWNVDGNVNELYMTWGYLLGVSSIEADVEFIAANGVAPASWAGSIRDEANKAWLAEVGQQWCQGLVSLRAAMQKSFKGQPAQIMSAEPQVVYVDRLVPAEATPAVPEPVQPETGGTTGQVIGRAYDALQELRLADALPIEDRAPLAALIAVLQTKNGSEIK